MPALRNQKHELFVQGFIKGAKKGVNARQAYLGAGYDCSDASADQSASRLLSKSVKVQQRMNEILQPATRKARVTVESLLDQLDETITAARTDGHHNAVVSALTLSAKLVGLLRERIEVGSAGEYAGAKTSEEIVEIFIAEHDGPAAALEAIDAMRAAVERRAADCALVVS
jgi:phage terminase small subunit